jgi:cytochrome c-type biogenesis protein CcmE
MAPSAPRRALTRKQKRLALIAVLGAVLAGAVALILAGLSDRVTFFRSPSEVLSGQTRAGETFRLGGLVAAGSVSRESGQRVRFSVTDGAASIDVTFTGILPDLFREGQGIVTEGLLDENGTFLAATVLAKHDENYMPREVADALKKSGEWRDATAKPDGKVADDR